MSWQPRPVEALTPVTQPSRVERLRAYGWATVAGVSAVGGPVVAAVVAHALGW